MTIWHNRALFVGPHVALVMSQTEYLAALAEHGLECADEFCPAGCMAVTHAFRSGGELVCLIGLSPDALGEDPIQVASLLCHEAVHVWQRVVDATALENPRACWGTEAEAYAIQNISHGLMQSFADRVAQLPPPESP